MANNTSYRPELVAFLNQTIDMVSILFNIGLNRLVKSEFVLSMLKAVYGSSQKDLVEPEVYKKVLLMFGDPHQILSHSTELQSKVEEVLNLEQFENLKVGTF